MSPNRPRGLVLPSGRILCTVRIDRDWAGDMWTQVYYSDYGGRTWAFLSRISDFGAPAAPLRLADGRHWPLPFSPTRSSGPRIRSGWWTRSP